MGGLVLVWIGVVKCATDLVLKGLNEFVVRF
jgi:hypothetical protein